MYNRVLNQKDLNLFKNQIVENDYSTKFPHIDLWGKDDAILKWLSVVNEFQDLNKSNLKVVDLGSGSGCVPHMISSLGNDVTAIDISNINHFCSNSLVKMVLNDVLIEIKEMKGRTVYHEWLLDGKLITRKKVKVSNNNWRTSSRQFFANSDKTSWVVRLVDEKGQVINALNFDVIYQ